MHFIKPSWLSHQGDGRKPVEVYSCHVSPDSERLATGGLDGSVRIWSTKAIYSSGEDDSHPRQLCSIAHHSGAVLTVRFSGNNRYLASGSDDKIVLVYERNTEAAPSRPHFGSNEAPHTENWRTHRRLAGHDNDVQDLGWSADSSILVSVGLDSKVVVWSGSTFERLKKIDVHESHVKGITFDPANKYFATASDDRTLRVFRFQSPPSNATAHEQAGNFTLEHTVKEPFKESPLTTYFRRPSWSPDGNHIATANAVNGPVSAVAIVNRGAWDSEINLIGHEGPVEVCAFAPRMFSMAGVPQVDGQAPQGVPVTVIACAGQDKALSIWNTSNPRPLVITQDVASKAISDLAWAPSGRNLFMTSLDGTILCVGFEDGDLGYVLGPEENEKVLQKFGVGRRGATLPEGPDGVRLEALSRAGERRELEGRMGQIMMDGAQQNGVPGNNDVVMADAMAGPQWQLHQAPPPQHPQPAPDTERTERAERERLARQKVTITKDGKKRIAPLLVSSGGGHSTLPTSVLQRTNGTSSGNTDPKHTLDLSQPYDGLPEGGMRTVILGNKRKEPPSSDIEEPSHTDKRVSILQAPDESWKRAGATPEFIRPAIISPSVTSSQVRLAVPKVRVYVNRVVDARGTPSSNVPSLTSSASNNPTSTLDPSDMIFEAQNSRSPSGPEPTKITIAKAGKQISLDYLPKAVLLVTGNNNLWAAACEDGTIHVFSPVGRRLQCPLVIEAQPCFLDCRGWYLLSISAVGILHVWNLEDMTSPHPPVSLAPILDIANTPIDINTERPSRAAAVTEAGLNSDGTAVISLSNGDGYLYSRSLYTWLRVSEAWWAVGSQYWDSTSSRLPSSSTPSDASTPALSSGIIPHLERRTNTETLLHGRGRFLQRMVKRILPREGYEGFETAVSISHIENRLAAAKMLGASDDFRQFLNLYARRVATEGNRAKVEELCRGLMGNVLSEEENEEDGEEGWGKVCGWERKELLRGVLVAIGKHRDLQRVTVPYARILGVLDKVEVQGDEPMQEEPEL